MVGPKKQDFWPWINKLNGKKKWKKKKNRFVKKLPKLYVQSKFLLPKIDWIFFSSFFPFEYIDSLPKILLSRTHHLWNSTTELILTRMLRTLAVRKFHFVILDVNILHEEVKGDNFSLPLFLVNDILKYGRNTWPNLILRSFKLGAKKKGGGGERKLHP